MSNTVFSRRSQFLSRCFISLPLLYPTLCISRAASLNSAIHHGLRRSKGVGFRGKERSQAPVTSQGYEKRERSSRTDAGLMNSSRPLTPFLQSKRYSLIESRNTAKTDGRKGASDERNNEHTDLRGGERRARSFGGQTARTPSDSDRQSFSRRDNGSSADGNLRGSRPYNEVPNHKILYPSLSSKKAGYVPPSQSPPREEQYSTRGKRTAEYEPRERWSNSKRNTHSPRDYDSRSRRLGSDDERSLNQYASRDRTYKQPERDQPPRSTSATNESDNKPSNEIRIDSRMPISIPYTTPASEFLYGTSVVEAALRSLRAPRRKLYKLYIYKGENREGLSMERDANLERLAVKNAIKVERVSGDWLRVMDKMSGGRPHNGYILEASPLPQKPVTGLGELTEVDGKTGFRVVLDHQSREEAAVNGTEDFVKFTTNVPGRKPLVLLLDSIVDPGNLGGIIRTAAFLGVTAIAVSTRNSASFTPVVLKASAGASENITLLSVNKPAGFLVDSQAAGWKVYAAVAPTGKQDPDVKDSVTTDDLEDPLSGDPCILMMGGEGEGLRLNLRSKANANLSILGSGRSHKVDSLNVSVAAGILCNAFLRKSTVQTQSLAPEAKVESQVEPPGDLF